MNMLQNIGHQTFQMNIAHIIFLFLTFLCFACDESKENKDEKDKKEEEKVTINVPAALENFDKSYLGKLGAKIIRMNIRRYGDDMWGTYWVKGQLEELTLSGNVKPNGKNFSLQAYNKKGEEIGIFTATLDNLNEIKGTWLNPNGQNKTPFSLSIFEDNKVLKIKLEELKVNQTSNDNKRAVHIAYPQLTGIADKHVSDRLNNIIEEYFQAYTKLDSVNKVSYAFKEDVKWDVTYLHKDLISICKHHNLSRNNDTQLFDDSHGLNMNFKLGKVYQIRDIFKINALDLLNEEIARRINKACSGALTPEELAKCKLKLDDDHSFSLSEDRITKQVKITFHLTERLPYKSRGCGYVKMEYQDIKDFLNPSGPLAELKK